MEPEQLAKRCDRLGLARKRLAELASLDESTVERTFNQKTAPYFETVKKIEEALTRQEHAALDYLARLYPRRAIEQATVALCPQKAEARP